MRSINCGWVQNVFTLMYSFRLYFITAMYYVEDQYKQEIENWSTNLFNLNDTFEGIFVGKKLYELQRYIPPNQIKKFSHFHSCDRILYSLRILYTCTQAQQLMTTSARVCWIVAIFCSSRVTASTVLASTLQEFTVSRQSLITMAQVSARMAAALARQGPKTAQLSKQVTKQFSIITSFMCFWKCGWSCHYRPS